eukprot:Amastigsp_a681006_24.p3 type:complete len:315 gc:universal Amastigsp_a681006_24:952-8(-)
MRSSTCTPLRTLRATRSLRLVGRRSLCGSSRSPTRTFSGGRCSSWARRRRRARRCARFAWRAASTGSFISWGPLKTLRSTDARTARSSSAPWQSASGFSAVSMSVSLLPRARPYSRAVSRARSICTPPSRRCFEANTQTSPSGRTTPPTGCSSRILRRRSSTRAQSRPCGSSRSRSRIASRPQRSAARRRSPPRARPQTPPAAPPRRRGTSSLRRGFSSLRSRSSYPAPPSATRSLCLPSTSTRCARAAPSSSRCTRGSGALLRTGRSSSSAATPSTRRSPNGFGSRATSERSASSWRRKSWTLQAKRRATRAL